MQLLHNTAKNSTCSFLKQHLFCTAQTQIGQHKHSKSSALTAIANLGRTTRFTDAKNALRNMYRFLNRIREAGPDELTVGGMLQELGKTFTGMHAGPLLQNVYNRFTDTSIVDFFGKLKRRMVECNIEVMTVHAAKGGSFR